MAKQNRDPDVEFWKEIRSLLLSMVEQIERGKLRGVFKISTASVRRAMRDKDRGTGP